MKHNLLCKLSLSFIGMTPRGGLTPAQAMAPGPVGPGHTPSVRDNLNINADQDLEAMHMDKYYQVHNRFKN